MYDALASAVDVAVVASMTQAFIVVYLMRVLCTCFMLGMLHIMHYRVSRAFAGLGGYFLLHNCRLVLFVFTLDRSWT